MKTKKKTNRKMQIHIEINGEENAFSQYVGNDGFYDYVNEQRVETYNALTADCQENDEETINRTMVAGLATLMEYSRQYVEFECVVGLFIETYIAYAKELPDDKMKRQELWRLYYTVSFANACEKEKEIDNGMLDFLEHRILYTLHMYLWSDYCKLKNIQDK